MHRSIKLSLCHSLLVLLSFVVTPSVFAQSDTLVKLDDSRVAGKLLSMTPEAVEMDVRRSTTSIPSREIDHIKFYDQARRTEQARDYIEDKQFELAARELATMNEEWSKARAVTVVEGMYLLAKVKTELALSGAEGHTLSDAVGVVREVRERGKEHYRYHAAGLLYAQLGKAAGRLDLAEKEYTDLADVPDGRIALEANLELGFVQLINQQYDDALKSFEKASAVDATDPESAKKKLVAKLYAEVANAGKGQVDAAVNSIQSMLKDQSPDDAYVNGYAYNALGTAYQMANKLKEAEVAFLHTELLFPSNSDAHAEALYHLVQIWQKMGKSDRITEGRDKLMTNYGGTYWTARLNGAK